MPVGSPYVPNFGPPPNIARTTIQINIDVASATGGDLSGAGSPVGSVTPNRIGQLYTDQIAPYGLWQATGLTNQDWTQLLGN